MTGLASKTHKVFDEVCSLTCIQGYVLVGGTALSLQITHRLSEDLDFCKWPVSSSASNGIPFKEIERKLKSKFKKVKTNPIDFDQADYLLNDDVKLQFFNDVGYTLPTDDFLPSKGNLKLAPVSLIGAMKVKTIFQRTAFRDYYDLYVILKEGHLTLSKLIELACIYDSKLRTATIVNRLTAFEKFKEEKNFGLLEPRYAISCEEIGSFFSNEAKKLIPDL